MEKNGIHKESVTVPYVPSASTQNQTLAVHMHAFACCCSREGKYLPASLLQALCYHTRFYMLVTCY